MLQTVNVVFEVRLVRIKCEVAEVVHVHLFHSPSLAYRTGTWGLIKHRQQQCGSSPFALPLSNNPIIWAIAAVHHQPELAKVHQHFIHFTSIILHRHHLPCCKHMAYFSDYDVIQVMLTYINFLLEHPKAATYDVVVVGCGPAGLTAALYASRMGLSVVVIGSPSSGSLSRTATLDNFPSFSYKGRRSAMVRCKNDSVDFFWY